MKKYSARDFAMESGTYLWIACIGLFEEKGTESTARRSIADMGGEEFFDFLEQLDAGLREREIVVVPGWADGFHAAMEPQHVDRRQVAA
ncbi:MAG TPA: hypothetical protein VIM02_09535 [Rhizomicrobium sp.]